MFFGVGGLALCGLYDMEVNKSLHNFHYGTLVFGRRRRSRRVYARRGGIRM